MTEEPPSNLTEQSVEAPPKDDNPTPKALVVPMGSARPNLFKFTTQQETDFSFKLRAFAGLTASMSTYQESLPFEYTSLKLPAWSVEAQMRVQNFLLEGDFKSLPGKVHSDSGHLNFYGWRYRHLWGSVSLGWLFEDTHHIYLKSMVHYAPTLFPTLVGPFHTEAALEKVLLFGVGVGYKADFSFYDWPFTLQLDLFNVMTNDPAYDLKYGLAWNVRLTRYHEWRNIRLGVSYDQVGQALSFTELHTGQYYPVKSFIRLHQILLHVEFPLL